MGPSGRKAVKKNLSKIIKETKLIFQFLTVKMRPMTEKELPKK